ncbi:MAG: YbaN family protein [Prevotellaceae bacterium]|jgi:uncharacterized membrane protein YbaN (DUF454 family)|nr:YbaN family protein [Prevotellaceae bacterium]
MTNYLRFFLIFFGIISLGLGIFGIFLPILPTTPFLLLSAVLFAKSSDKLYIWLLNHKILGEYIRSFLEDKSIPLRVKILSVTLLWATMLCTIFFAVKVIWLKILLIAIAIGVTVHILSYKTRKR